MTLDAFLKKLNGSLRDNPATHPAKVAFDLADRTGATVTFAGPDGGELGPKQFKKWWKKGGPDPFVDHDGRATLRIKASHRITDWVVLNARLTIDGLKEDKRHYMLRSWVVPS